MGSNVLADMLAAGAGPMRIEIDEPAIVVEQFLDLASCGDFYLPMEDDSGKPTALIHLSRLSRFLNKYDCPLVRRSLCNNVAHLRELPPIALLIAEIPDKPVQFARMLDKYEKRENTLWLFPNQRGSHGERAMVPDNVPIEAYATLPVQYHWALKMSSVGIVNRANDWGAHRRSSSPGQRFLHFIQEAERAGFHQQ